MIRYTPAHSTSRCRHTTMDSHELSNEASLDLSNTGDLKLLPSFPPCSLLAISSLLSSRGHAAGYAVARAIVTRSAAYRLRLGAFVSKVLMTIGRPRTYVSQVLPSTVIDVIRGGLESPVAGTMQTLEPYPWAHSVARHKWGCRGGVAHSLSVRCCDRVGGTRRRRCSGSCISSTAHTVMQSQESGIRGKWMSLSTGVPQIRTSTHIMYTYHATRIPEKANTRSAIAKNEAENYEYEQCSYECLVILELEGQ